MTRKKQRPSSDSKPVAAHPNATISPERLAQAHERIAEYHGPPEPLGPLTKASAVELFVEAFRGALGDDAGVLDGMDGAANEPREVLPRTTEGFQVEALWASRLRLMASRAGLSPLGLLEKLIKSEWVRSGAGKQ